MDDQRANREGSGSLKIFCLGARRGAKFGIMAGVVIWAIYNGVTLWAALFLPGFRETVTLYLAKFGWGILIAVIALELVAMALIFAILSALMGGVVVLMRNRGAKPMGSNNN
jgi:hypothetical protein